MPRVVIYTRAACHLCEEMKAVLLRVRERLPFDLQDVDVSTDPQLEQRYGEQIPVLEIDGRMAARYRIAESELVRQLRQ